MPNTPNGRVTLAGLEANVTGITHTIADQSRRFEEFARDVYTKIERKGITPATWLALVALVVSVSVAILSAGAQWTNQRIAPIEASVTTLSNKVEKDRDEAKENDKEIKKDIKTQFGDARAERVALREEARQERLLMLAEFKDMRKDFLQEVKDIRGSIVTRGEHEQRWTAQTQALVAMDRRLDETRKQVIDIAGPQDAFKTIEMQLRELRAIVFKSKQEPQ